jgi:hypothetical protein
MRRLPRLARVARAAARAVMRASYLLVALAVLFGIAQAGSRYFYCEALGLSAIDPCGRAAHTGRGDAPCPLPALDRGRHSCCELLTMPSMPAGAGADATAVAPAPVGSLLPAVLEAPNGWRGQPSPSWKGDRLRAPPRPPGERRAQLMVFLT